MMMKIVTEENFRGVMSHALRELFWLRVDLIVSEVFERSIELSHDYRAKLEDAPFSEQILAYHEDPSNVAFGLVEATNFDERQRERYARLMESSLFERRPTVDLDSDDWIENFGAFAESFVAFSRALCSRVGLDCRIDDGALHLAHQLFIKDLNHLPLHFSMRARRDEYFLRLASLLLRALASPGWLTGLFGVKADAASAQHSDPNVDAQRARLASGRESYIAWQFVLALINSYRKNTREGVRRIELRVTTDFEDQIVSYLSNERSNEDSLFLILKALVVGS